MIGGHILTSHSRLGQLSLLGNVPSMLRGCAAAHVTRNRRAAVSNCRAVMSQRDVHFMAIKPLAGRLWSGD